MTIGNAARIAQPGSVVLQAWRQQHGPEATRSALALAAAPAHAPARRAPTRLVSRGYNAADTSNLTASFQADYLPLNLELERTLRLMVGRSRALAKNNDYVKKFSAHGAEPHRRPAGLCAQRAMPEQQRRH
jgi:hypothetical protein